MTPLPHLETCWLSSLRNFLAECNGRIEVDNSFVLPLQREHDFFLMDAILESKQFTPDELCLINYCRLHLQAVTVSDITLADGVRLDPYFIQGRSGPMSSTTTHHKVNQARPNEKSWNLWKRASHIWTSSGLTLRQPLGRWLTELTKQRRTWPAYFDPHSNELLLRQESKLYSIHPRSLHGYAIAADGHTNTLPPMSRPATTLKGPTGWAMSPTVPCTRTQDGPVTQTAGTFSAYIQDLPPWEQALLEHVEFHKDLYTLHHFLNTHQTCLGVSDGSVITKQGAYGWCLSTSDGIRLATGMGPAQGMSPSSYRAEGYGMLSILRFLTHISIFCGTPPRCSAVYSDNIALVLRIARQLPTHQWYPNETLSSEWDVVQAIVYTLKQFPVTPIVKHVKGHQDRDIAYALLSLQAQLNVDADAAATLYQIDYGSSRFLVPRITGNDAQLILDEKTVTYNYVKTLRQAYSSPLLLAHIGKRNKWSEATMKTIDWISLGQACHHNHMNRHFVVKISHDLLPTRSRTKKYDPDSPSHCIYCSAVVEDRDHLLRCTHTACATWRSELLRNIRKRSDVIKTDPVLLDVLMTGLHAWLHNNAPPLSAAYPAAYRRLVREQTTIGWRQLFNGRWSTEWARLHNRFILRHYDPIPSHLKGTKWTTTFIDLLWQGFRTLWDARNGKVHGVDSSTRTQARRERVHRELKALYLLRPGMRHCDRAVFHDTVEEHIDVQPVWAIQNWLRIQVPMAKHSVKEAARSAISQVRTIVSYFRTQVDTPNQNVNPNMIDPSPSGPGRESTLPAGRK